MGKINFTASQQKVIDFRGNNLLVSAGAGSGKTTVMIERIKELMLDKKEPAKISNFLIISFTKASASDMKNKLIAKLSSLEPTPYILEQLDDILTSDVSNFHSFCARLLKSYFYEVSLDPTFVVIDESEANVLKDRALKRLFNAKTESGDKAFFELIDIFAKHRSDAGLKNVILKISNFLGSVTDKKAWFERTINSLYETDLKHSVSANIIMSHLIRERIRMLDEIGVLKKECERFDAKSYVAYLDELESKVLCIREDQSLIENAKRLADLPKLSRIPAPKEGEEQIKAKVELLKNDVNKRMDKLKEYALADNADSIIDNLVASQKQVFELYKLVNEFEEIYSSIKKEKEALDFNDLEQYTLNVLKNPTILEEIRNKYTYIMVDEDQDINAVQEEILNLLSRGNNLFMVGDIKQSIYRFRLCDPEIFLDKYYAYQKDESKGMLIKLNENFRSKSAILDFINAVFNETMTENFGGVDYKKEAQLVAGSDAQKDDKLRVGMLIADMGSMQKEVKDSFDVYSVKEDHTVDETVQKATAEGLLIAGKIAELVRKKKVTENGKERFIKFSDITILAPARTSYLDKIVETLRSKGIPVSTDVEASCLDDEYVYSLKSFLEVISCEKVDISLFSLLRSKLFDFSLSELASIKIAARENKFFFESVEAALASSSLEENLKQKLKDFFEIVSEFRQKTGFMLASDILKEIIDRKSLMTKVDLEIESEATRQKIDRFLLSLGGLSVYDALINLEDANITSEPLGQQNSVKVMTIHKSKGLEFKVVFLAMASRKFNLESLRDEVLISKDLGIAIDYYDRVRRYKTPTLAKMAVKLLETRKMLEEQQRLLYVALTRATDYLFVTFASNFNEMPRSMPASPMCFTDFMGHLLDNQKEGLSRYDIEIMDIMDFKGLENNASNRDVIISDYDEEGINAVSEVLAFKYEHEEDLKKPLKTAVTYVIKSEEQESQTRYVYDDDGDISSSELGTLYHLVMANLDLAKNNKQEIEKQILQMAETGIISDDEASIIKVDGIYKLLNNPEFVSLCSGADKVYKEKEFYMLYGEGEIKSVMQGIIDLLIIKGENMYVLDYKTGNITSKNNLEKYRKQLELYSEAAEHSFGKKVQKAALCSLKNGDIVFS